MQMVAAGLGAVLGLASVAAHAQGSARDGDMHTGRSFALQTCTPCHVVSAQQLAPPRFAVAPSFQSIANLPSTTALSLQTFLVTPHPSMPNLMLSADEVGNVVAYILSLKKKP
jgi:mono/diheme cytochrome c family protein